MIGEPQLRLAQLKTLSPSGPFHKYEIPALLMGPVRQRQTGRLTLLEGSEARIIGFVAGSPVFAMSSVRQEHLGQRLIASSHITEAQARTVGILMQSEGIRFGEAMLKLGIVQEAELEMALMSQRRWLITQCLDAPEVEASFEPSGSISTDQASIDIIDCIEAGIRRYTSDDVDWLRSRLATVPLVTTSEEMLLAYKAGCAASVSDLIDRSQGQQRSFEWLIESAKGDVHAALAIVLCGLATPEDVPPLPATAAQPVASTTRGESASSPAAMPMTLVVTPPVSQAEQETEQETEQDAPPESGRRTSGSPVTILYCVLLAFLAGVFVGVGSVVLVWGGSGDPPLTVLELQPAASPPPEPWPRPALDATGDNLEPRVSQTPSRGTPERGQPAGQTGDDLESDALWEPPLPTPLPGRERIRSLPREPQREQSQLSVSDDVKTAAAAELRASQSEEVMFKLALMRKLMRQENYEKVRLIGHEVLAIAPTSPVAYRHLGIAYSHLGARALACESYRRYLLFAKAPKDRDQVEGLLRACK